ncbi:hypothetical protein K488DRAFT_49960 [Vararia minispora EC-137]|uniref:Uncharacterized protein n=1 Tax=Vararia minispora EC-137 TaxID=1314806 RepID=A0ACB8QL19_9AGAM|nr:hypothetical protein K488DRAFT_49960 [Vararia minispora EC-137]
MPLAPVNEHGAHLYYEDTGPIDGAFTTLIVMHGTGVNGAIFHRMLPFARTNNLRIVLVNRRDYPNSTPLSDVELALLDAESTPESRSAFFLARGLELAEFLAWFARTQGIRPKTEVDGHTQGGMGLVAWSSANNVAMAMFGNLDVVPAQTLSAIEPYLRTYIHYDGPRWAAGYPPIKDFFEPKPLANPALSDDEKFEQFKHWVSAYHDHPNIASRSVYGLTHDIAKEPAPTFDRMSVEDAAATGARFALFHSEKLIRATDPPVLARNRERALGAEECVNRLADVPVKLLQCEKSLWEMISVMWEMQDAYGERTRAKKPVRKMEFHMLEGSSHFAHWDEPERLTERFAQLV